MSCQEVRYCNVIREIVQGQEGWIEVLNNVANRHGQYPMCMIVSDIRSNVAA
jgi:hypothetical protein